jgi:CheY-like chemotaxis protein
MPADKEMKRPTFPKATILVVDDFDDIRVSLRLLLEKSGYSVVEAQDGLTALKTAMAEHPDLILMDLFMPKYDGFTAAQQIHRVAHLREVPIIAISAYGELGIEDQLRIQAEATGFTAYVSKPFDSEELLELVYRMLPKNS